MKILFFLLAVTALAIGAFLFQHNAPAIINWTNTLGMFAPVFFLVLYCLATILFLPTMVLTLAGGALFGPVAGTFFNLLGATTGAACAFCISRYLVSDKLAGIKNMRIRKLIAGVEGRGWQFVALVRLVPIIPFNLVNYGLGVTKIKFSHYLITTIIFLIPAEIVFTYFGYASMAALTHPQELFKSRTLIILSCIGILFVIYTIVKRGIKLNPA